jgi:hypothetical protein
MATVLDNLTAAKANVAANLAAMTASPKPNYSLDGESYSWAELFDIYMRQLLTLDEAIERAGGPFEIRTQAQS